MSARMTGPTMLTRFASLGAVLTGMLLAATPAVRSDDPDVQALVNARIVSIDASGELSVLSRGTVLIRDGRIEAVGEGLAVPDGAEVVELEGRWLLPGFIDAHRLIEPYLFEGNEYTEAITEDFDPLLSFDPWDAKLAEHFAGGVTALAVSPGESNIVGGRVHVVKIMPGQYPPTPMNEIPAFKASLSDEVLGGSNLPRYPTAFSGAVKLLASWIEKRGASQLAKVSKEPTSVGASLEPEKDLEKDPAGRVVIHVDTRTQAERLLVALADSSLKPVLVHGSQIDAEAWARLKAYRWVVLGPYRLDQSSKELAVPAALEREGASIAFCSDGTRRDLLTSAVLAMRNGLSRKGAVAALTDNPAKMFGIGGRVGRIERGLDADLVAWSTDPFSLSARVERVWVEGATVFRAPTAPKPLKDGPKPEKPDGKLTTNRSGKQEPK